jgi:nitric oxide dioxygenase
MEDFLQRRKKMSKQMTPADIELIQQSFARLVPISDKAAALFYDRLFEVAPEVKPLFRGDMTGQGRKLMATLALVVNGLNKLDAILPAASVLAKRHVGYGVKAVHYAAVGAALLWTLEKGLGPSWTPELAAAWTLAYTTLSGFMIGEAYGHASVHVNANVQSAQSAQSLREVPAAASPVTARRWRPNSGLVRAGRSTSSARL